jgi:acyl transferase domain-containing protein/acyl carrier protein
MSNSEAPASVESIAVIGLNGRFPGARNVDEFWNNLSGGVETISRFSDQELKAAGTDPAYSKLPGFVNAGSVLTDIDQFDAVFFGYSARDAECIDPQQRLFLESAWECLESAGYDPETYPGLIGVFGGSDMSSYIYQLYSHMDPLAAGSSPMALIGNDKDYLTTQVSYKLNLKGPSMAIQTSCSTSLVAVCVACQSLWSYACDMALAGGVAVGVPQKKGYFYQVGGILSPDGHCRTFDAEGQGTVVGSGLGMVLLKRLSDAIADGDTIRAVIKGAALNNDGSLKVGYTAPSIAGQAHVIAMAQAMAGIAPETISYVEAHGTATLLGDPIEVAALTQAFSAKTDKKGFCAIGSVKSNVGHLASAAGVTGLIKTVLALEKGMLPPSLNFRTPNPQINFAGSPFYVNDKLQRWETNGTPRRAGVSSFGVGGTNAHMVLEEAPPREASGPTRPYQLMVLSARSSNALEKATANLVNHLEAHADLNLADVSYTLAGRRAFAHRRFVVNSSPDTRGAAAALAGSDPRRVVTGMPESGDRGVVFMFSGQGSQYVDMGRELYAVEPAYRSFLDNCCDVLRGTLGFDLRDVLFPPRDQREQATGRLQRTAVTQPALFSVEYALAKLWMEFGIEPKGMIGHSIGEYVAACLAGVFSLEDALGLVTARGRLMDEMPAGSMLAARLSESEARLFLEAEIALAAVNAPGFCVFSGPTGAIDRLDTNLSARGVHASRLHTSHAFHSSMMDPVVPALVERVRHTARKVPQIPYLSNLTGTWITPEAALDADYWGRHLRETVRFGDGLAEVMKYPEVMLLEVGPGQTLSTLARQQPSMAGAPPVILTSMRPPQEAQSDEAFLLDTVGMAWLNGASVNWPGFYSREKRRRLTLPTYPFERQRYWVGPLEDVTAASGTATAKPRDVTNWFYTPEWQERPGSTAGDGGAPKRWLIFSDGELGSQVRTALENAGHTVWTVVAADRFAALDGRTYTIRPGETADYERMLKELRAGMGAPECILHLWTAPHAAHAEDAAAAFNSHQASGFHSHICLAQGLEKTNVTTPIQVGVVSSELHALVESDKPCPSKATLLGACKVLPQEFPNLYWKTIDMGNWAGHLAGAAEKIVAELSYLPADPMVAYRGGQRWVQEFAVSPLRQAPSKSNKLRKGGVYLITGGLGNIGLEFADALAARVQAKLVLIGRSQFPERSSWEQRLASNVSDKVNRKIRRLLKMEELGAEILVLRADSADREQMSAAVAEAYNRFGTVHGVIHGAGNTTGGGFTDAKHTDRAAAAEHFRPKVEGLLVLEELFRHRDLDFILLLSSLSGVLGGLGLLSYSAANIYLDAFAAQQNQLNRVSQSGRIPWISVNWDAWQFPGQEEMFRQSAPQGAEFLYPAEGVECLFRILERAPGQIVVSTSDLKARIDKWIRLESVRRKPAAPQEPAAGTLHARPNLSSQFVAPRTEVERKLTGIWEQILGITPIGIYDKFFELGGHSLLAIQLISRMRDTFHVELSAQRLFEAPTITQLAATIEADIKALREAEAEEDARTEEILRMVEQLSEEEVTALLNTQNDSSKAAVRNA